MGRLSMTKKIELLAEHIPVNQIYWELMKHPEWWNKNTGRTDYENSPHKETDDIWMRFGSLKDAATGEPHDSLWYPEAEHCANLKQLCFDVMRSVNGVELGGVLMTRIPAGKEVKPHTDPGWHARRYDKFAVQIAAAPGQTFCFDEEFLETKPGDLFYFDNSAMHWVVNPTPYERVTLIICIRREF
jgi:hypothetical protein